MDTILVVTVGGSCQPIVTAVTDYRPAHIYFLASVGSHGSRPTVDATGVPCADRSTGIDKPAIVSQTGLSSDQYTVCEINDPDSLQDCYAVTRAALGEIATRFPNH